MERTRQDVLNSLKMHTTKEAALASAFPAGTIIKSLFDINSWGKLIPSGTKFRVKEAKSHHALKSNLDCKAQRVHYICDRLDVVPGRGEITECLVYEDECERA